MMKRLFISSAFILLAVSAFAQDELKDRLIEAGKKITAVNCDFVQTKSSALLSDKMVSSGRMSYRKPDFIEWTYLQPFEFSFIMNGNEISIKKDGKTSTADANQNKIFREMARMVKANIDGDYLSNKTLFDTQISVSDGTVSVVLLPKNKEMKKIWSKMTLIYNQKDFSAKSFVMYESSGDISTIEFKNCRYDFAK